MIISVGYRVKSKRGVEFRRWANSVLKDYLIKGYAINQCIREKNYQQMVQLVRSMARTVKLEDLSTDVLLLSLCMRYAFVLLWSYPHILLEGAIEIRYIPKSTLVANL